jgi:hypothetical protein
VSAVDQPKRAGCLRGCLLRVLIALVVLTAIGIAIGFAFHDENANLPTDDVNAGPAENYERGDVSYIPSEHVFVTRLADGTFIALYDMSPKQQELDSDCRIFYDDLAQLGTLEQLPGFEGGLVEECDGARSVWRADGTPAFGSGSYADLDRFQTRTNNNGELIIDTSSRTCTRSRGVPGVPPFTETTCRGND